MLADIAALLKKAFIYQPSAGQITSDDSEALIPDTPQGEVSGRLDENINKLREIFYARNTDLKIKPFSSPGGYRGAVAFVDGLASGELINRFILIPFMSGSIPSGLDIEQIESYIPIGESVVRKAWREAAKAVLAGDAAVFIDGFASFFVLETKGFESRSISPPLTEGVEFGSQEAFTENIRTSVATLRRMLRTPRLCAEYVEAGNLTKIPCAVMYINGVADKESATMIKERIKSIKADFIQGAGMLEQFLTDSPFSMIPDMLATERPDNAARHLSDGQIAVFVEGTPYAIILPITFADLLQIPEDRSLRWQYSTFRKAIRVFACAAAIVVPAIFIAVANFHREMLPTELLITLSRAKHDVPFPLLAEYLLMELALELIRDAGIRLPGSVGATIGIVGGIVLGQAAVDAKLVSPAVIIVVAFVAICNYIIPDISLSVGTRIVRLLFLVIAAVLGIVGVSAAITVLIATLASCRSFGVPMLSFMSPGGSDIVYQPPVWDDEMRPGNLRPRKERKQKTVSRPWYVKRDGENTDER